MDLMYSAVTRCAMPLPSDDTRLVQSCIRFQTLEQHSAAPREGNHSDSRVLEMLMRGAANDLLISDEQFIEHCRNAAAPESRPPSIATIGTTTRNRPEMLFRGLVSFVENTKVHGRAPDYVVIDDGLTAQEQSATRDVLQRIAHEQSAVIRYAGRQERQSFAADLAAAGGVAPDVVEFALFGDTTCPITTGAARNSLLLDTIGDLYLLVDDDSVCRIAPCPELAPGVAIDARGNPTELWFYRDRDAMLARTKFAEQDLLGLHEFILGRQVAECLPPKEEAGGVDFSYMTTELGERLWSHPGRVLATSAGVVGDSGMGSTAYLGMLPASENRLARSEQDYIDAVVNRQILRAPLRTTIARGAFCAGANLGLDNRRLLPPFVPVQRNSDGLFARTLQRCFRDGYKGYIPWAVLHDPVPPRSQSLEEAEADATRIRLTYILRALIVPDSFTQTTDPAVDLQRLGRELIDVASQGPKEFEHTVKPKLARAAALYLEGLRTGRTAGLPEFYTRRQNAHWRQLSKAVETPEYFVPRDLPGAGSAEQIQRVTQRVVLRFGQLLRDWPALIEGARALRSRGVRLAQPV